MNHTYEIRSKLGSGGSGDVYKAWHKRLEKHIVLKELRDSADKTTEMRRNEVEALKNIKNMYIPQVFDLISEDESSFTVMEYIEGVTLDKLLAEGKLFSTGTITRWYYQLATALEALHENNVCHRDIKPSNIIRTPGGDVCLIDYNSALVAGNNTKVVNRSFGYASPEQYSYFEICQDVYLRRSSKQSKQTYTGFKPPAIDWKLSDIYSLGATMYHLFTDNRPHLKVDVTALESVVCDGSSDIVAVIEKSMRINPAERYKSAGELCDALYKLQSNAVSGGRP